MPKQAKADAARMAAGFGEALDLTREAVAAQVSAGRHISPAIGEFAVQELAAA